MLKFKSPLIVVSDMKRSISFYEDVIGDRIAMNFGENVTFEGGYSLQEQNLWLNFIQMDVHDIHYQSNDAELYFDEDDFDGFVAHLNSFSDVKLLHDVMEMNWGQRVIRFYDPDFHIIEVGENMDVVIRRMLANGMSVEEVSKKSQFPIEYVKRFA
jgi:Glyoxalase/Bleomycin resistance protein/Dioxygenase superfamily.